MSIKVSELAIYPIKSCAQIPLETIEIGAFGPQNDRRWMVVDEHGKFITQRQQARMCLIQPQLEGRRLTLSAPGMSKIDVIPTTIKRDVLVWNDACQALDCGDQVAQWISDYLKISSRIVFFPGDTKRRVDPLYAQEGDLTAFSDGFPLLVISQASLDDLNSRLESPLPMLRFRPNVVVRGCSAYDEDTWHKIRIGNVGFRIVKPCSRCVIPNIDPDTGVRGIEPSKTLMAYRRRNNKIYFGQNMIADNHGVLDVGMKVQILD